MHRVEVESTNIASIGFDEEQQILEIGFIGRKGNSGAVYQDTNVPYNVWISFLRAPSKGGFFAAEIRGKFSATKVSG